MNRVLWWLWKPWHLLTRLVGVWVTRKLRPTAEVEHLRGELAAAHQRIAQLDELVLAYHRDREDLRGHVVRYRAQIERFELTSP